MNKLIFVYNADSSIFAQVTDFVHKAIRPETYDCNLCKITHSNTGMKTEWKQFITTLPFSLEFLHKDEFIKHNPYQKEIKFPAIFKQTSDLTLLINRDKINGAKNIQDLKQLILNKLNER